MGVQAGDWVALGEQAGQVTRVDGAKIAVAIVDGPTKWRTASDVAPLFGSGDPKSTTHPGDWLRLANGAVGQCLKVDGGRINLRLVDGKVLWRGFADITPPAGDAPRTRMLGAASSATRRASAAAEPPAAAGPNFLVQKRRVVDATLPAPAAAVALALGVSALRAPCLVASSMA